MIRHDWDHSSQSCGRSVARWVLGWLQCNAMEESKSSDSPTGRLPGPSLACAPKDKQQQHYRSLDSLFLLSVDQSTFYITQLFHPSVQSISIINRPPRPARVRRQPPPPHTAPPTPRRGGTGPMAAQTSPSDSAHRLVAAAGETMIWLCGQRRLSINQSINQSINRPIPCLTSFLPTPHTHLPLAALHKGARGDDGLPQGLSRHEQEVRPVLVSPRRRRRALHHQPVAAALSARGRGGRAGGD